MKSKPVSGKTADDLFIKDVFGGKDALIKQVREKTGLTEESDREFLTDEIILAPLHISTARMMSENAMRHIYDSEKYKITAAQKCCLYHLAGSICTALASRCKNEKYAAYRKTDWLKAGVEFHKLADDNEFTFMRLKFG